MTNDPKPIHFIDETIEVIFDVPPTYEKSPHCPQAFIWQNKTYQIVEALAEWTDFTRRGKAARNMRPSHAEAASTRGSLGVGRFYFRVKVDNGQIFDIYYDRAPKDASRRKGAWFLYQELGE